MRVAIDAHDGSTVYADLRDDERLTDESRAHAIKRARELGAEHVEFWRSPYGDGADRMAGFIELERIAPEWESGSDAASIGADEDVTPEASTQASPQAEADRDATDEQVKGRVA